MKVENMTSSSGNKIANQFIITGIAAGIYNKEGQHLQSGKMFQSYDSIIAYKAHTGTLYLDKDYWDYSRTTSKYRNQFTRLDTQSTKKGIEAGTIKLLTFNS